MESHGFLREGDSGSRAQGLARALILLFNLKTVDPFSRTCIQNALESTCQLLRQRYGLLYPCEGFPSRQLARVSLSLLLLRGASSPPNLSRSDTPTTPGRVRVVISRSPPSTQLVE